MDINELRKIISEHPKFPGTENIRHASVCNDGFPGNFNLSFTEAEWIKKFNGQYLNYDHDLIYSKIQPCIRHQDWASIKNNDENSYRYLSVFDMADIGGAISFVDGSKLDEVTEFSVKNLYDFLIHKLKLSPDLLRIKYCQGGNVTNLTNRKYPLKKDLEADPKIALWQQLGISKNQLIPDRSRDTLLALHIYLLPTPWGYRNEIFYEHEDRLLDIATFEYLFLRPIFNTRGDIKDLNKWEHCFVISAVGVERILMVVNNYKTIMECSHIKPLTETILDDANKKNYQGAVVLTEAIRVLHRIITDAGDYQNLSRHRKQKIRDFYSGIFDSAAKLNIKITESILKKYLKMNAKLQSYYPELNQSVDRSIDEIMTAKHRFENDNSKKLGGVAQQ